MTGLTTLPKVLVVTSIFLPGYKAGGPIRSIANLVEQLGAEYQFFIVTADRDLGDTRPYPDITPGVWQPLGKACVRYLPPRERHPLAWRSLLRNLDYDVLYLNSFFARNSVMALWLRKLRQLPDKPVILAPRGEFSRGALALKAFTKQLYLGAASASKLSDGIFWQASSDYELADIQRIVGRKLQASVAPPLAPPVLFPSERRSGADRAPVLRREKRVGQLRAVFLSRITPKKGLDLALLGLAGLSGDIEFDIYGPIEDRNYWRKCESLLARLGPSVRARYCGAVAAEQVGEVLARYHLLYFPTRGENFGHVIAEALAAGCPILISDATPWRDLQDLGIGWDLPLADLQLWRQALNQVLALDQGEFDEWCARVRAFVTEAWPERQQLALTANRQLFDSALRQRSVAGRL